MSATTASMNDAAQPTASEDTKSRKGSLCSSFLSSTFSGQGERGPDRGSGRDPDCFAVNARAEEGPQQNVHARGGEAFRQRRYVASSGQHLPSAQAALLEEHLREGMANEHRLSKRPPV